MRLYFLLVIGCTIENLKLENVSIKDNDVRQAALIHHAYGSVNIRKVGITGNISGGIRTSSFIGNNYSSFNSNINFESCYSRMNINTNGNLSAGFASIEYPDQSNFKFKDCYFDGSFTGNNGAGATFVCGANHTEYINCYYNIDNLKNNPDSKQGTALNSNQFADENNFKNWDFENVWIMKDGYPELRIFEH